MFSFLLAMSALSPSFPPPPSPAPLSLRLLLLGAGMLAGVRACMRPCLRLCLFARVSSLTSFPEAQE